MLTETGGVSGADAIWPFEKGSAINIHVYCKTPEEAKKVFSILAQEGETIGELTTNPPVLIKILYIFRKLWYYYFNEKSKIHL